MKNLDKLNRHFLKLAAAVLLAIPLVATAAGTLDNSKSPPKSPHTIEAAGTWIDCNIAPHVRTAGPNTFVTVGIKEIFTGTMEGTYEGFEHIVVRSDGTGTFRGSGIFTGTVGGRSGTATFSYHGGFGAEGAEANWSLVGLTESLASVSGLGTFDAFAIDEGDVDGLFCAECDGGVYAGGYTGEFKIGR